MSKKYYNKLLYTTIILLVLVIMLIGEYLLAPTQNILFYILLIIMAISLFLMVFYLIPEDRQTKRDKILSWTGLISFLLISSLLYGLIHNDFTRTLIFGVILLIIGSTILLIRINGFKDNVVKTVGILKVKLSKSHINYGAIILGFVVLIISETMFAIFFGPYSAFISLFLTACTVKYMTEGFKEFLVNFVITIFIVYVAFLIFLQ